MILKSGMMDKLIVVFSNIIYVMDTFLVHFRFFSHATGKLLVEEVFVFQKEGSIQQ